MKSRLGQIEKSLKEKMIDVDDSGVKIRINAKAELQSIELSDELFRKGKNAVEKQLISSIKKAQQKSHELMTDEAKKLAGGLNIPGLF